MMITITLCTVYAIEGIYAVNIWLGYCCDLTKGYWMRITKMEVVNEMEILITLIKYNTHQ